MRNPSLGFYFFRVDTTKVFEITPKVLVFLFVKSTNPSTLFGDQRLIFANGIVLLLSMAVGLSSKESQRNSIEDVLGDIWKDFNFARLKLGLEPFLQVSF